MSDAWVVSSCCDEYSIPIKVLALNFDASTGALKGGKVEHGFGKSMELCELRPMAAALSINELGESLSS